MIHSVEKFFGDLLQTKDFTFLDGEILRGALLVSAVLVVLQIVITVIAAAFYNVFAELFGGDRDHHLRRRDPRSDRSSLDPAGPFATLGRSPGL